MHTPPPSLIQFNKLRKSCSFKIKKTNFNLKPLFLTLITFFSCSTLSVQANSVSTVSDGGNYEFEGTDFTGQLVDIFINNQTDSTTAINLNQNSHDWLEIIRNDAWAAIDIYNGKDTAGNNDPAGTTTIFGNLKITQDVQDDNDIRAINVLAGNQVLTINGDVDISTKGSYRGDYPKFWGEAIRNVGSKVNINGNVTVLGVDFSSNTSNLLFAEGIATINQPSGGIAKTVTNIGDINQDHILTLKNIYVTGVKGG